MGDKKLETWVRKLRRQFHMHPETAFEEYRTSARVAEILGGLGMEVRTGFAGTGVTGLLGCREAGPVIALRADMDALPLEEKTGACYGSKVPGVMHACGHDAHTAILLGTARNIADNRIHEGLRGSIKFVFQPAEEGVRGAKAIIEEGALRDPAPDISLACHVTNDLECGKIGVYSSVSNASSDRFKVTVRGRGGHAAYPDQCADAIVASCYFVTQIQSIVARNVDPTEAAVVSVGVISGGTASNILPESVVLKGTVRAFREKVRLLERRRLFDFAKGLKKSFRLEDVDLKYIDGCPPCVNSPRAVSLVRAAAEEVLGPNKIKVLSPKMGAEDFAYFAGEAPAALFRLGTANAGKGITGRAHGPYFDIDEDALMYGVKVFTEAVKKYLGSGGRKNDGKGKGFKSD